MDIDTIDRRLRDDDSGLKYTDLEFYDRRQTSAGNAGAPGFV